MDTGSTGPMNPESSPGETGGAGGVTVSRGVTGVGGGVKGELPVDRAGEERTSSPLCCVGTLRSPEGQKRQRRSDHPERRPG